MDRNVAYFDEETVRRIVSRVLAEGDYMKRQDASLLISSTIKSTLNELGIDQLDFQGVQKDNAFVRDLRLGVDRIKEVSGKVILKTVIYAIIALIVAGIGVKMNVGH